VIEAHVRQYRELGKHFRPLGDKSTRPLRCEPALIDVSSGEVRVVRDAGPIKLLVEFVSHPGIEELANLLAKFLGVRG
jgi:hypothetical protein